MKHEILVYNQTRSKVPEKFILDVILRTFDFLKLKQPAELAVLIVSAEEIRKLNKIWRKKNYTPDELSFGLNSRKQAGRAKFAKKQNKMLELGEIVVNVNKISDKNNLSKILIHSLLHLLGYDHERSTAEAKKMEHLEEKILNNLEKV
ncbi:MAG TPA: rRNA maturation RNase YbeY [Candidatus Paceibacterota bacterium]